MKHSIATVLRPALGAALATGTLSAQEVGTNDFRISDMGVDGIVSNSALLASVAYNADAHEYLVVWHGVDDKGPLGSNELEIYGQRFDARTGQEIGENDFRISDMGPEGDPGFGGEAPAVAYNPTQKEYLVVWRGDDDSGGTANQEYEVFGQRLDGATAAEVGENDFRISDMGPDGSALFGAFLPKVACDPARNEYLVVWSGDDDTGALVDGEFEIFGQRLDGATGAEIGENDFRVSDMGVDGDITMSASFPVPVAHPSRGEYLVVWSGTGDVPLPVTNELEIYGQRIDAATGSEIGTNDFRISDMGPDGSNEYFGTIPAAVLNGTRDEYLVVWQGREGELAAPGESEIYGQRLDAATGAELGENDFRISNMGPDGDTSYPALWPDVTYDSFLDEYLVVWNGRSDEISFGELEIYGQRLDGASGAEIAPNDFRISDLGPDGDSSYGPVVLGPGLAANPVDGEYFVVWTGDDDSGALAISENEVFGQRVLAGPLTLTSDRNQLSLQGGGTVSFSLDAGSKHADATYVLLGSTTGIHPGLNLGGAILPLNVDSYLLLTLTNPTAVLTDSIGFLGPVGQASAGLVLPAGLDPSFAGIVLHHAYALLGVPFTSNPVSCTLTP